MTKIIAKRVQQLLIISPCSFFLSLAHHTSQSSSQLPSSKFSLLQGKEGFSKIAAAAATATLQQQQAINNNNTSSSQSAGVETSANNSNTGEVVASILNGSSAVAKRTPSISNSGSRVHRIAIIRENSVPLSSPNSGESSCSVRHQNGANSDQVAKLDFDAEDCESEKLTRSSSGSSGRSSSGFSSLSQSSHKSATHLKSAPLPGESGGNAASSVVQQTSARVNHHHFVNHCGALMVGRLNNNAQV